MDGPVRPEAAKRDFSPMDTLDTCGALDIREAYSAARLTGDLVHHSINESMHAQIDAS